ncbi:MAG: metallophosphoesterase [Fimbriimonadaceae bacterium]|nr:metallophosphoesterase [Fimbriimonadaceae bacterium]
MAIFFTADTHLGHANIIKHCRRPFPSVEAMDAAIIERINARVGPDDWLYHLGDFSFRGGDPAVYRARIRCRNMVLILGNHDPCFADGTARPEFASLFKAVHNLLKVTVQIDGRSQIVVLCHYAMRVWDRSHHGTWHLYGHSHGSLPDNPHALSWDVGVDANDFSPLSVPQVAEIMSKKRFVPIDHHGRKTDGVDGVGCKE